MTDPKLTQNRTEAEQVARETIDPSQADQIDEFLTFSLTVPEYQTINGQRWRQIALGLAGNVCYPE